MGGGVLNGAGGCWWATPAVPYNRGRPARVGLAASLAVHGLAAPAAAGGSFDGFGVGLGNQRVDLFWCWAPGLGFGVTADPQQAVLCRRARVRPGVGLDLVFRVKPGQQSAGF
jgi:hypothetical protein